MKPSRFFLIALTFILLSVSCDKDSLNPYLPNVTIRITIDPNSTQFLELNTVGGWLYLDEKPGIYIPAGSRGIIVWRMDTYKFKAFERQPPNDPFLCCNENHTVCGKLVVDSYYPFVKDTCTGNTYMLLDGSLFEGEGKYPLIEYGADYDGSLLYIHN